MQTVTAKIYKRRKAVQLLGGLLLLGSLLTTSGCKKFLASYSQNQTFSKTANDLEELLLGQGYAILPPSIWIHIMDDDIDANPTTTFTQGSPVFSFAGYHYWQPAPWLSSEGREVSDNYYITVYEWISALNTILYDAPGMKAKGEPADQLQKISGESHFLRAYYYFYLCNIYGRPYNTETAATDYAVPLKITPEVQDKYFSRATVKQVYDQIVSDLLNSEKELEGFNQTSNVRVNQSVVQAFLSRVYLYMSEYDNALTYANKVIDKKKYTIKDLNTAAKGNFLDKNSVENIFCFPFTNTSTQLVARMQPSGFVAAADNYRVSAELRSSYAGNDLRPAVFFQQTSAGEVMYRKEEINNNILSEYLIRFPEVLLNKAEALAALGRAEEAVQTLQELRKNRLSGQLDPITQTGAELVNAVREERRRELCFECHRWFDLRRMAVNTRFPFTKSIRHTAYGYNNSGRYILGYYELKPYQQDKIAFVAPVPKIEIDFNQGAIQNEERVARPVIH